MTCIMHGDLVYESNPPDVYGPSEVLHVQSHADHTARCFPDQITAVGGLQTPLGSSAPAEHVTKRPGAVHSKTHRLLRTPRKGKNIL
jgi:hypothetical protein